MMLEYERVTRQMRAARFMRTMREQTGAQVRGARER